MLSTITLLFLAQLDHFEFSPISTPQTAGDSFAVTVYAYDAANNIYPYSGPAILSAVPGPEYGNKTVTFSSGVYQGYFTATLANTYAIRCQDYSLHSGESNQVEFVPNDPYRLLTILPGQTYAPGIDSGRTGTPTPQPAGTFFSIATYLTDRWCNQVVGGSDSIRWTSTDPFRPAQSAQLAAGSAALSWAFRLAQNNRFYTADLSNPAIRTDTSAALYVYAADYARLLIVAPGETLLPGDTTRTYVQTPGKSGEPSPQYLLEDFTITVYATDSMWNRTAISGNTVSVHSDFPFSNPAPVPLDNGAASFTLSFSSAGENQNLWADQGSIRAYDCYFTVVGRTADFVIVVDPDTVGPGAIAYINTTAYNTIGEPLRGKLVNFSVVYGNGGIPSLYQSLYTDSLGQCQSQFTCTAGFFDETDTIRVAADTYEERVPCYVMVPDSTIMAGNIVAYPNPFGSINAGVTRFVYYLSGSCNVTYAIYDPFGNLVHREEIAPGQNGARSGLNMLTWNGRNDKNHRVASGVYYVVIKGYSHTNVFLDKRIRVGVIW